MTSKFVTTLVELEGTETQRDLALMLGVEQGTISLWLNGQSFPTKRNIERMLKLRSRLRIDPVIEMEHVNPKRSGKSWHVDSDPMKRNSIEEKLRDKHGVYLFYDSRGIPTYVGMTQKTGFFKEIEQRLSHALLRGIHYRKDIKKGVKLVQGSMTSYLSAYSLTDQPSIHTLEAFAIRAFVNVILNRHVETLR